VRLGDCETGEGQKLTMEKKLECGKWKGKNAKKVGKLKGESGKNKG